MDTIEYPTALWGFSWDEIIENESPPAQGVAKLEKDCVSLTLPFGQLLASPGTLFLSGEQLPTEVDYLYGFSQNGRWLVLVDAFCGGTAESFPGGPRQTILASQILESRAKFDPNCKVTRITAKMLGLREWYGKAPYQAIRSADNRSTTYELDISKAVEQNVVLFEDNRAVVKLVHYITQAPLDVSGFSVSHDCGITVDFSKPVTRGEAVDIMLRISDFISFCVCFDSQVTEVELHCEDTDEPILLRAPFVVGEKPSSLRLASIPIKFDAIADRLPYVLGNWLNASGRLAKAENMLCSVMFNSWKLPLDLKFISAAQLLESLSKHDTETKALEPNLHKKYVEAVLENVEDPDIRNWAKQKLSGNMKGQKRLLEELLNRNGPVVDWLLPNPSKFIGRHISARNGFTHRDITSISLENTELYWHTEGVLMLSYCIIASAIGIPNDIVISRLRHSGYKSHSVSKLREIYA